MKAKFKVGQVVSLDKVKYYREGWKAQQFQKIVGVFPWKGNKGFGLQLQNGDECHEKWARALTSREAGKP